jgi:acyl-CoA reductase-like NAD-dependent aldehyde dehydrogenase
MSVENESTTASSPWVVPQWINGKEEKTPDTFPVMDPSTGKECWRSSSASREDALRAVSSASSAFQSWSKTKPALRSKILFRAVDIIEEFSSEYAFYMETEMGAERNVAKGVVLPLAVQLLRDIASRAACLTEGSIPVCGQEGRSGIVVKVPYGVTLGIVPW